MGNPRTPANTLRALDPYWQAIQAGAPRAERNLDELEPLTSKAMIGDQALAAEQAIARCVNLIATEVKRLHGLVAQFDYPTAGEVQYGTNIRQGAERWVNEHAEPGCVSCGRPEVLIYSVRWNDTLRCRWCGDFQRATGFDPTPNLLLMHQDGKKMTNALVERELRPLREQAKKLRGKTKTTRKKKTAA